jgi:FkbH-like protein
VDLDDTLWGGVVGEVGPEGIDLDPYGAGRPYLELQRFLKDLRDQGVPIAVVSKNDVAIARRVFIERPEMVLKMEDLTRFDVSWNPKYEAIGNFASQLNIAIDTVCFLDDSPKERDETQTMLPGLIVPELPSVPNQRPAYLRSTNLFMSPVVTDADRSRADFFAAPNLPSGDSLDGYLRNLEMVLTSYALDQMNFDRSLSLLHKTNQFNATLWRPSRSDLKDLMDQDHYAFAFRLSDRVVDAGIISVVLARKTGQVAELLGWVLSCRVFGRGVEWAVAQHLRDWMQEHDINKLRIRFKIGPRNGITRKALEDLGFQTARESHDEITFVVDKISVLQHHIRLEKS